MSATLVLKFGGTSLGNAVRVRRAARRIAAHAARGRQVIAVVSAAGDTTDRILAQLHRVGDAARLVRSRAEVTTAAATPGIALDTGSWGWAREADRALTTGEDRAAALLASALWQLGVPARSLRGGEAGVVGSGSFGAGGIDYVVAERLRLLGARGIVPVVSGFQALRPDGETVTLGRGGSDTTAVRIAAALGAACHIVTDVAAVYDRDPRHDSRARPLRHLSHTELVRLTEEGAQVVHPAAARAAADAGVPLRVYHFTAPLNARGTVISSAEAPDLARSGGTT